MSFAIFDSKRSTWLKNWIAVAHPQNSIAVLNPSPAEFAALGRGAKGVFAVLFVHQGDLPGAPPENKNVGAWLAEQIPADKCQRIFLYAGDGMPRSVAARHVRPIEYSVPRIEPAGTTADRLRKLIRTLEDRFARRDDCTLARGLSALYVLCEGYLATGNETGQENAIVATVARLRQSGIGCFKEASALEAKVDARNWFAPAMSGLRHLIEENPGGSEQWRERLGEGNESLARAATNMRQLYERLAQGTTAQDLAHDDWRQLVQAARQGYLELYAAGCF
jgi:hypothetical protein